MQVNSVSGKLYAVKVARTVWEGGVDALLALRSLLHLSLGLINTNIKTNVSFVYLYFYKPLLHWLLKW